MSSRFNLLARRRFLPFFLTQFLGAFNDNLYKQPLIILLVFRVGGEEGPFWAALAGGLFILPFLLFSALAGQLADKYNKTWLIRRIKVAEIIIMIFGGQALLSGALFPLLAVLFLMGTQSAFFGPIKYAILPVHLRRSELVSGDALVEAATFLAILTGVTLGSVLIALPGGEALTASGVLVCAVCGWVASLLIPTAPAAAANLRLRFNPLSVSIALLKEVAANRLLLLTVMAIAWFFMYGSVFVTQLPAFTREVFHGDESVVAFLFAVFSFGIAFGALLSSVLLKGEISARYASWGVVGVSLFSLDLALLDHAALFPGEQLPAQQSLASFLSSWSQLRAVADCFLLAASAGVYIVPLYAVLQVHSRPERRSRMIAATNIADALLIVLASLATAALLLAGMSVAVLFTLLAALNLAAAFAVTGVERRLVAGRASGGA